MFLLGFMTSSPIEINKEIDKNDIIKFLNKIKPVAAIASNP